MRVSESFEIKPSNKFLIEILKDQGYISSYSEKDGQIKVNTKHSR